MAPGWYPPVISLGDGDSTVTQQWPALPRESISRVDASDLGNRSKLRKVERACDYCRRRKSKCDGPQKKDHICSSCEANSRTCTYLVDSKPRGPSKAYIAALENRSEKVEALLQRLRPEIDLAVELGPCQLSNGRKTEGNSRPSSAGANLSRRGSSSNLVPRAGAEKDSDVSKVAQSAAATYLGYRSQAVLHDSSDSDEQEVTFSEGRRLTSRGLESSSEQKPNIHQLRFQGKSSSLNLISTTMELIQRELAAMHISESDAPPSDQTKSSSVHQPRVFCKLNPEASELYNLLPWEKRLGPGIDMAAVSDNLLAAFPPDDLAEELIRLFFLREHATFPLLHRPTFERQWRDKLYLRDGWFASVCMAVFGLASRWTTDPRVLSRGDQSEPEGSGTGVALASLPGWQYVSVTIMASAAITERQSGLLIPPELCEIQTLVLLSQYLRGTEGADTAWFWLSVGVVKTQDMGLHRRQTYGRTPTIEDELWKRAYWHLVALDRFGSMLLGKPYFAREEDLDLDLPLEVDDEYWGNGADGSECTFHQPSDKPSLVSGFVCWIKLSYIAITILKTLYSPRKSKRASSRPDEPWEEVALAHLNDMLLQWVDELPAHLRWRPDMPDTPFASQAATLLATYHLLQALIQRPFIFPSLTLTSHHTRLSPYSPTAASEKALAVCLSASRASVAIVHTELRAGRGDVVTFLHVLFDSTGLLFTQLWGLVGRWAERGTAGSAHRDEDDIDVARQISALLDEISGNISRMQALAPKWELARIMLDDIQRALPTRFANLTVESTNNEALIAAQWATITRPAGMPAATLPYTPALPSAASSFGRAGFSMMDQPGQFDIAPFQEAGQSAAAVADRPLREDTFLPGHPPPLPHAWGSDRLWTAHAHNISARAGDGRLTRADEVQWSNHHLLGPPPIVGDTFPALSLPADTSAIGGALNAHSQYE